MTPDIFTICPDVSTLCFFGAALAAAAASLCFFIPMSRRAARSLDATPGPATGAGKVSVIVYSHNAAASLSGTVEAIRRQDYPDFEIIVVDDGSSDDTQDVLERLAQTEPRLRHTFVPEASINLSRRKLALTLGIKRASGDIILTTDASCRIGSDRWMSAMAAPFGNPAVQLVLGVAAPDCGDSRGRYYRMFDYVLTTMQWLSAAVAGKPFRGDSRNMAYRRSVFFEHKGFGSTIWTHYGEDDLFISQFASGVNTVVSASRGAILSIDPESCSRRAWIAAKERRFFTSRYLHTVAYLRNTLGGWTLWLALALFATAVVPCVPSVAAAATMVILGIAILLDRSFLSVARPLGQRVPRWRIILYYLRKPLSDARYALKFNRRRKQNFTWRR